MNKKIVTIILILLHIIFYPLFSDVALATVGGPTLLGDFGYSEKEGMVYFISSYGHAMGGPKIERYDPVAQKREIIFDNTRIGVIQWSDELAAELAKKYNCPIEDRDCIETNHDEEYAIQKEKIWNNLNELPRIDLLKNNIKVESFIKEREEIKEEMRRDWWPWRYVTLQIIVGQGAREEIGRFDLNGCEWINGARTKNFEINFDGFLIPNSNSILFLAHTKGICDEMGYGLDEIFLIDGFEILDSQPSRSLREVRDVVWKSPPPGKRFCFNQDVCPTPGGIFLTVSNDIAIADEEPPAQGEIQPETIEEYRDPEEQQEKPKIPTLILGSAVSILSLFLIYLYFKKRRKAKS